MLGIRVVDDVLSLSVRVGVAFLLWSGCVRESDDRRAIPVKRGLFGVRRQRHFQLRRSLGRPGAAGLR